MILKDKYGRAHIIGHQANGYYALVRNLAGTETIEQITGIKAKSAKQALKCSEEYIYKRRPWLKPSKWTWRYETHLMALEKQLKELGLTIKTASLNTFNMVDDFSMTISSKIYTKGLFTTEHDNHGEVTDTDFDPY